jgi:hypothetical protein
MTRRTIFQVIRVPGGPENGLDFLRFTYILLRAISKRLNMLRESLPAQQMAPTYGPSGADLLSDQTKLTYQFNNGRMPIERFLMGRIYNKGPRLQAVVGFDVDRGSGLLSRVFQQPHEHAGRTLAERKGRQS